MEAAPPFGLCAEALPQHPWAYVLVFAACAHRGMPGPKRRAVRLNQSDQVRDTVLHIHWILKVDRKGWRPHAVREHNNDVRAPFDNLAAVLQRVPLR